MHISIALGSSNYSLALNLLESFTDDYSLSSDELDEVNRLIILTQIEAMEPITLSASESQVIHESAENGGAWSSAWARGVLNERDGLEIIEPIYNPEWITQNKSVLAIPGDQIEEFIVYPNPAKDFIILQSNLTKELVEKIQITDIIGKILATYELNGASKEILDIREISSGVCYIRITDKWGNVIRTMPFVKI